MAFALSIKSKQDFPEVGSIFLLLTLIISSFTLLYSSLFLEQTIVKCGITHIPGDDNSNTAASSNNYFVRLKNLIFDLNETYLMKSVDRSEEVIEEEHNTSQKDRSVELNHKEKDQDQQSSLSTDIRGARRSSISSVALTKIHVKKLLDNEI
jgi:hypothetical protein